MSSTTSAPSVTNVSDVLVDGDAVDGGEAFAWTPQWSYADTSDWNRRSATCSSGLHQSPVDLPALPAETSLHPLATAFKAAAKATWTVSKGIGWIHVYNAGGLRSWWSLQHILLRMGSEHTLQQRQFALELQFIHEYSGGGLWPRYLVIAVWAELNSASDEFLASLLDEIERARAQASTQVDLSGALNVAELLDRLPADEYYTYRGSLTTPPCAEGVDWIVMHTRIGVTNNDLDRLAALGLRAAVRRTQRLNGRLVGGILQPDAQLCTSAATDACGCCSDEGYVPNTLSLNSDAVNGQCMLGAQTSLREAAWCKRGSVRQRFVGAPKEASSFVLTHGTQLIMSAS
jgi:carbonic anhydrase